MADLLVAFVKVALQIGTAAFTDGTIFTDGTGLIDA